MARASSPARITAAIDPAKRTTLTGDVSPRLSAYTDQGPVSSAQTMTHVYLVLKRSAEQQQAFNTYLQQLQDKKSPNYHRWLTPEQIGEEYGVASSDIAQLQTWLTSYGLRVDHVSKSQMLIDFSGTAAQLQSAFQVSLRQYSDGTQTFIANTTAPTIPKALTGVVHGVARLNTLKLRSYLKTGLNGQWNPATKRLEQVNTTNASGTSAIRSQLTYTDSTGTHYLYTTPADAATIYDTPNPTLNANYSGTKYDGSGVTIAIGGDADIDTSYPVNYRTRFLGDTTVPTTILAGTDPNSTDDATEAYLDLEVAGGLAPGAKLLYYYSSDLFSGVIQAIEDNKADIISLSFGECEAELGSANNAEINEMWAEAAAAGIAVTVSTGDSGSAGCDNENDEYIAEYGLAVNGLASTPNNIAVGGTDYDALKDNYETYAATTNSSSNYYRTALSYIPENPWNDSPETNSDWEANTPYYSSDETNIVGDGGGKSGCASTTSGSCAGYTKPLWQRGETIVGDGVRDIPDVSLLSADGSYGAVWLICVPDADCTTNSTTGKFGFSGVGGTSASTPAFAGILALVQQATGGTRLGQAAATLYDLASTSSYNTLFHDITVGNNSVYCTEGTTNCTLDNAGYYFLSGYDAGVGYDLATGLGSVDTVQLINSWSTATSPLSPTVSLTPSASTLNAGDSVQITVYVTGGGSTTPAGTVTLISGAYSSAATTLSNGQAQFTIGSGYLVGGNDTVYANYSGDSIYGSGSASTTLTVNKSNSSLAITPTASSYTLIDEVSLDVVVSGAGRSPSGNVTLTTGSYSNTLALSGGKVNFSFPGSDLKPGSNTINATYAGDDYYNGSSNSTIVSLINNPATITITPASTQSYTGQPLAVSVAVSGTGITPTGTIMLTAGSYSSASIALSNGTAAFTIPANSFAAGIDAITITYSGDSAYASQIGSNYVTVAASTFTLKTADSALAVASNASSTASTLTLASTNGYAGTINLSCALTSSPSGADPTYMPTCSIPASVMLSATTTSATATLTIHSTAANSAALHALVFGKQGGALFSLAALLLVGFYKRGRKFRAMLTVMVLAALCTMGMAGCGGSRKTPVAGTTRGSYTFTVTATDSANTTLMTTSTVNVSIP